MKKKMNIHFQKLSPTDIAFVIVGDNNNIYIDEKFRSSPYLQEIIDHERQHIEQGGKLNLGMDSKGLSWKASWDAIRRKPMVFFAHMIPISYHWEGNKKVLSLSLYRILTTVLFWTFIMIILTFI